VVRRRLARRPLAPVSAPRARLRHRWLHAVLAGLALAGIVAVPALPAAADVGNIAFDSVSGNGTGNLAVTITSDDPLGSIKIHLMSGANDVLDLTDFAEQGTFSNGSTPQTWTLSNPSTDLAALAAGTYTATIDVTDLDGDQSVTGLTPTTTSTFNFQIVPSISLSQATVNSTAPAQDVSITGQLNAVQPLGASATAWSGQTVTITDSSKKTWTGTSTSTGSFSIPVTAIPGDQYTASVAATQANLGAVSPTSTTDQAQFATTSINATATPAPYGKQTITGTLTYQSGLSQVASPGGVTITATAHGQSSIATTTSTNGSFSMVLPAVAGSTIWNLSSQANDMATTPFLAGTTTSISAIQTWPASVTGFSATLSKYYDLTVGGCLSSSLDPPPPPDYPTILIQYELTQAGPWRELGTVSTTHMTGCPGAAFLARGGAPAAAAYYRASFPGDGTYQPADGTSVRAALIATRFDPFTASPGTLASRSKKLTISGTLQYLGRRWRAYAHQRVLLIYSTNNRTWYGYHWVRTNSKGAFSLSFADSVGTAHWSANYDGNGTHLVSGAPEIKVTVRRSGGRSTAALAQGQPVTPFFATAADFDGWRSRGSWPFLVATDPLLILMGPQL
jgi:hypothetical protein